MKNRSWKTLPSKKHFIVTFVPCVIVGIAAARGISPKEYLL